MSHQPYNPRPLPHAVVNRGRSSSASLGLEHNGLGGSSRATASELHHQPQRMKQSYGYPLQLVCSSVIPTMLSGLPWFRPLPDFFFHTFSTLRIMWTKFRTHYPCVLMLPPSDPFSPSPLQYVRVYLRMCLKHCTVSAYTLRLLTILWDQCRSFYRILLYVFSEIETITMRRPLCTIL